MAAHDRQRLAVGCASLTCAGQPRDDTRGVGRCFLWVGGLFAPAAITDPLRGEVTADPCTWSGTDDA